jgi:hypothetical protein
MLKRSLVVVSVVLLAGAAYATDLVPTNSAVNWQFDGSNSEVKAESYNWPAAYIPQDICVIPVKMDVGYWIKVNNAKDLVLKLKQVEIHKYSGSVDVTLVCNVNIKLSVVWTKDANINLGGYSASASVTPSSLAAPGGTTTVSLALSNVDLSNLQGGQTCLQVGTVTLKVVPDVTPALAGGCSS